MPSDGEQQVKQQIHAEREELATAVEHLRAELHEATNVASKLPALPLLAAGFVLGGGIGAVFKLIFRRGREGDTRASAGRYRLVDDE